MGTEYIAVCQQCHEWCDMHKLAHCLDYTEVTAVFLYDVMFCEHYRRGDEDPKEGEVDYFCIFRSRAEGKFNLWYDHLHKFWEKHTEHYPIVVDEHTDLYLDLNLNNDEMEGWTEFEPNWFEELKDDRKRN